MEAVVLHRVAFLEYFCPKRGQDFKPSAAPLYPNISQVPPRAWISFSQALSKASHRTTGISGPCHHHRLTLVFVVANFSGMNFRRSLA